MEGAMPDDGKNQADEGGCRGVTPIACPVCMHEETVRARQNEREPCRDDLAVMRFVAPPSRGACGNPGMPTRFSDGEWECQICGCRLSPHEAGVLLDAALSAIGLDCDSFDGVIHADARRALAGRCR